MSRFRLTDPGQSTERLATTGISALEPDVRATAYPLPQVHEVNARCLEIMIQVARTDPPGAVPLIDDLSALLREMTPEMRARAARCTFLLVDLEFRNGKFWARVQRNPHRSVPIADSRGVLPRAQGLQLARTTLILAWECLRADPYMSSLVLGMSATVAEIIAGFSLPEMLLIVDRQFRHARPRWEDRPQIWRELLRASRTSDIRRARDVTVWGLQLNAGAHRSSSSSSR